MLEHGGRLLHASQQYGIALADWLDLSTGINPQGWPVPELPAAVWSRLPEAADGLVSAARDYYGAAHVLPLAGSQAAIQALPHLRRRGRVGVLSPGYAEHAHAWRQAGHNVVPLKAETLSRELGPFDAAVLIQPNNPTGTRFSKEVVLDWHATLAGRGGWLVVDEAFIDATPADSLAPFTDRPGLIVLRSLGKFFGLAGARVGFALAQPDLLQGLAEHLGPWAVAGPSRYVAEQALRDTAWQASARAQVQAAGLRLAELLRRHGLAPDGGCALFQWLRHESAADLHKQLARRGILTRYFDEPASLRLGLPGSEADWSRLDAALAELQA
ncbi:MAG: threonine-phosphate decarboxylase [Hydrogenophilaceae bacterium]|nr:threonine-phosphate decarboxylase [Hydrogenophilaceae bacterium]